MPQAKPAPLPEFVEVALASPAKKPPAGGEWLHEVKYDGYRMLCRVDDGHAMFLSRTGKDWTSRLMALVESAHNLSARQVLLDGEAAVLGKDGVTNFQLLQNSLHGGGAEVTYFVFDILHLDGRNLMPLPLDKRRAVLETLLQSSSCARFRFSAELDAVGSRAFRRAAELGAEGIVSKRRDSAYQGGRSQDWLKVKCLRSEDLLIGGFTQSTNSQFGLGALLVGAKRGSQLTHVGRVGTGFTVATRQQLAQRLAGLAQTASPFANLPRAAKGVTFVEPQLIAHVEFAGWTDDGLLRHACYRGLREDLSAADVPDVIVGSAKKKPVKAKKAKAAKNKSSATAKPRRAELDPETARQQRVQQQAQQAAASLARARITSPGRVVYPSQKLTKYDVANYYARIAPWMLPHLEGRPLALVRCPKGMMERCFFQKHAMKGLYDSVLRVKVPTLTGEDEHLAVQDVEGLLALAQFGVLELHAWGTRYDNPERPDRMVIDLDPHPDLRWARTVAAAFRIRKVLDKLGLTSLVKTTGGRGLHVVVPLRRRHTWDQVHGASERICSQLASQSPGEFTTDFAKSARKGKILLDYLRNTRGATAVAAYSTRARKGAPVSTPVSWEELESLPAGAFHIESVLQRIETLDEDPWSQIDQLNQWITKAAFKRLGM